MPGRVRTGSRCARRGGSAGTCTPSRLRPPILSGRLRQRSTAGPSSLACKGGQSGSRVERVRPVSADMPALGPLGQGGSHRRHFRASRPNTRYPYKGRVSTLLTGAGRRRTGRHLLRFQAAVSACWRRLANPSADAPRLVPSKDSCLAASAAAHWRSAALFLWRAHIMSKIIHQPGRPQSHVLLRSPPGSPSSVWNRVD